MNKDRSSAHARARKALSLEDRITLRADETAEVLGVSKRKLCGMRGLPRIHEGGVVLYPVEGLREWARKRAQVESDVIDAAVSEVLKSLKNK
jgi:hypothetical protein